MSKTALTCFSVLDVQLETPLLYLHVQRSRAEAESRRRCAQISQHLRIMVEYDGLVVMLGESLQLLRSLA